MNEASFWENQDEAQKTIAQFKLLKAQTEGLEQVIERFEDATVGYELASDENDDDLLAEVDEQLFELAASMEKVELQSLLSGKHDHRDCYVSIQSGDGGTEADDWAAMLDRMYRAFWDAQKWKYDQISLVHGTEVGISNVTYHLKAPMAFGNMNCERGTHRLARVSPFNSQGKRQTSFATVDVIPEFEATDLEIEARHILRLRDQIYGIYSECTGQERSKIENDCERNLWLSSEQMLEYGLIDSILTRLPGEEK